MLHLQIKFGCNWTSNFQKNIEILHFPPNLTSDDSWPWYMTFDLINVQRNPHCIFDPSLVPIELQLFQEDPNNENQRFQPNLTSDVPWPWYVTFDLINIWRNPYCIFDQSLVVIGLQLFKGDLNNDKPNETETYIYIYIHPPIHIHTGGFAIAIAPYCFSSQGNENRLHHFAVLNFFCCFQTSLLLSALVMIF